jgi:hypothetical protein
MEDFKDNLGPEKMPEAASDIQLAGFFVKHIENPCSVEVERGKVVNIRPFYIREAKKALENMTNPFAIELLERKIKEYEKETE